MIFTAPCMEKPSALLPSSTILPPRVVGVCRPLFGFVQSKGEPFHDTNTRKMTYSPPTRIHPLGLWAFLVRRLQSAIVCLSVGRSFSFDSHQCWVCVCVWRPPVWLDTVSAGPNPLVGLGARKRSFYKALSASLHKF